jgi:DNA-binding transcriptional LysR family regulator
MSMMMDFKAASSAYPLRVNLAGVDLNLLVALDALLEHLNVTHAANMVGLSQPAMSRALARLRGMFEDELLVRTAGGYVRTVRGEHIHDRLPRMLESVRELVSCPVMDAEGWGVSIRMAVPDHQALVWMTGLVDRLRAKDADAEIVTEPLTANMLKRLETGDLDMAVGHLSAGVPGFFQRALYTDEYACLLRKGHPILRDCLTEDRYLGLQHAVLAPGHYNERNHLADALAVLPPRQRCILSPNTIGTAMAVVESEMVLTVPRRVAVKLACLLPLQVVDLPIKIAPYEVMLLWHERSHRDAGHRWLRSQIAKSAGNREVAPSGAVELQGASPSTGC